MNVWLLVFTNVNTERVFGPFTSVAIDDKSIFDTLTGRKIAEYLDDGGWRIYSDRGPILVAHRIVVQQGGFESPWGERGK